MVGNVDTKVRGPVPRRGFSLQCFIMARRLAGFFRDPWGGGKPWCFVLVPTIVPVIVSAPSVVETPGMEVLGYFTSF